MKKLLLAFKSIKTYRKVSALLAVMLLCLMWFFSAQNGEDSGRMSGRVLDLLLKLWGREVSYATREYLAFFVRKAAHFSEFTAIGFLLTSCGYCFDRIRPHRFAVPVLFSGLLAAVIDETIQLFVEGRAGMIADVWIDFGGVVTGFLLALAFYAVYRKIKHIK